MLEDEELLDVTGGGSGHADSGIRSLLYTAVEPGHYYCDMDVPENGCRVFYVTHIYSSGIKLIYGCAEKLMIDDQNNWHTVFDLNDSYRDAEEFRRSWRYTLNIRP